MDIQIYIFLPQRLIVPRRARTTPVHARFALRHRGLTRYINIDIDIDRYRYRIYTYIHTYPNVYI